MKQRKLNKRKGFTLVELLVVIAILAVLATVSVVGYTSFTKKAKVSNDVSLTTQMNTILQANEVTDGKNATPHEAVEELVAGGLDVTKLTPTANDYNYVWDSTQNRIFLLDEDKKVVSPTNLKASDKAVNLFAFVGKETELNSFKKDNKDVYSYYLKDGYDASTLTVSTGLDVGNNTEISSVNYTSTVGQEVTIRTNGGTLEVNAGSDTVYHYGATNYTNIKSIATESYHENGVSAYVRIEQGHFVAEKTAKVINLNVANSSVTITEVSGAKVVDYSKASDSVEVKVNGTTKEVSEVKSEETIKSEVENSDVAAENGVAEINGIQYKSLQSALDMVHNGDVVVLNENLDIEKTISLEKNVNVTLNMNGKTITNTKDIWDAVPNGWSLLSVKAGNLTITGNGSFLSKSDDCYAVDLQDGAKCTIENGTFVGNIHAVYVHEGELLVNGGTYSIQQKYPNASTEYDYVLNCLDATRADGKATIVVTGGTFDNFNPTDNWAEGEHTNFCSKDYTVTTEIKKVNGTDHTFYTVVKA